ncbi:hypothetical protein C1I97_04240 [Streptomyces sp. NTH33]|nr:hypothetical protein C1I97_04240 [Streptomyces sp. NTH33]
MAPADQPPGRRGVPGPGGARPPGSPGASDCRHPRRTDQRPRRPHDRRPSRGDPPAGPGDAGPVTADALGHHHVATVRLAAEAGGTWSRYAPAITHGHQRAGHREELARVGWASPPVPRTVLRAHRLCSHLGLGMSVATHSAPARRLLEANGDTNGIRRVVRARADTAIATGAVSPQRLWSPVAAAPPRPSPTRFEAAPTVEPHLPDLVESIRR